MAAGASKQATAPFGTWKSPLDAELVTSSSKALAGAWLLPSGDLLWQEGRPSEGGRNVVMLQPAAGGEPVEVTPSDVNVRTRVHEYGGGAVCVHDGFVYFSSFADQRLFRKPIAGGEAVALTPDVGGSALRYADACFDATRGNLVLVREDHRGGGKEPTNEVVAVSAADGGEGVVLATGADFYCAPRVSPDGKHLAYVSWDHPNMPWDSTSLWVAPLLPDGSAGPAERLVGAAGGVSVLQPRWSPSGRLLFASDAADGWWNLFRWEGPFTAAGGSAVPVLRMEAEFAGPHWVFGQKTFDFLDDDTVLAAYKQDGLSRLARVDVATGALEAVPCPYSVLSSVSVPVPGKAVVLAASAKVAPEVALLDLGTGEWELRVSSSSLDLSRLDGFLSEPRPIDFPSAGGVTSHAIYYPPCNKDFVAPEGERPPLLIKIHGGPTAATDSSLKLSVQYWCSRGWAVADVNYGGSTGYGRGYRELLYGRWGIRDVDDCCACARYLAEQGLADPERLCIDGGSAGGYTTLAALTFRDTFKGGASLYGVSDLTSLAADTHKFESRYLDQLVGPYKTEEDKQLYRDRSPINHLDSLECPIILFQGLEDKVVPPSQTEMMYEAVKAKGIPVCQILYEGEQHGFRKKENIIRTLTGEMLFFARLFGFEMADGVEPIHIDNLDIPA
mmetsp:Transcript_13356/g.31618  ORF Transcript_13356/g.31618 Transcript_13356/m.31618 type:complete len:671 (-) Transcript_13356:139-2151(-)|eukprot:CAMPEP_0177607878 /NCGR_PEP_ID=MMETSP0419_2-20121207/18161_1 /TAXON_ID=582737 /ORGANISM="Tetraselmis sp., Strain GSL018" /LENGTH=670 /DNA_ID=CAMNT_0019102507 /DNA_START=382 /DNA_END=2394 /DNA_ORIENTATION=-